MESTQANSDVDISVIVPVYNSGEDICITLDSLISQDFDKSKYEVVIVDNGSTDDTPEIVQDYCEKYPDLVKLFFQSEIQSSYAARNVGISHAKGEILAFVDADMWMDTSWLNLVVREMQTREVDYMGCRVSIQNIKANDGLAALYNQVVGFPIEQNIANQHFTPTCCLVARKALFEKIGTFDEFLISGGDFELGNRAFRQGINLHYADHIVTYHPARATLKSLRKKYFRIGRGLYQIIQRYPDLAPHERNSLFRRFLPPNPVSFLKKSKVRSKARQIELTEAEFWRLYFIDLYVKWARSVGYTSEQFFGVSPSIEVD